MKVEVFCANLDEYSSADLKGMDLDLGVHILVIDLLENAEMLTTLNFVVLFR